MRVTIEGKQFDLTKEAVEDRLRGVPPERIQQLAAFIGGQWYPVRQALGAALERSPQSLNSGRSFGLMTRLGFQTHDMRSDGPLPAHQPVQHPSQGARLEALRLAVQASAGKEAPERVVEIADQFMVWLGDA